MVGLQPIPGISFFLIGFQAYRLRHLLNDPSKTNLKLKTLVGLVYVMGKLGPSVYWLYIGYLFCNLEWWTNTPQIIQHWEISVISCYFRFSQLWGIIVLWDRYLDDFFGCLSAILFFSCLFSLWTTCVGREKISLWPPSQQHSPPGWRLTFLGAGIPN